MFGNLSLRAKILWIVFAVNVLSTAAHTIHSCSEQRMEFLRGVDKKLTTAAHAVPLLLPPGYPDSIAGPESVSSSEYHRIISLLTTYASRAEVKYLYMHVHRDGRFYEVATSETAEERAESEPAAFFSHYEQPPPEMKAAWDTGRIRFTEYTDEWGHFRSIFVPLQTAAGVRYLAGADVALSGMQRRLARIMLVNVLLGAAVFLVVWLVSHLLLTRILSPICDLTGLTHDLAAQDFSLSEDQKGGAGAARAATQR